MPLLEPLPELDQRFLFAFLLTLGAGLSTGFGSLLGLISRRFSPSLLTLSLSFSAGVMLYVSFVEIFPKARQALSAAHGPAPGYALTVLAFFAGMVLRESQFSHRAAEESLPLRDAFAVLFFVSVGMLFDPHMLINDPLHVLAVVAIIIIGKSVAAAALVLAMGYPASTALTVSASLAQIGEFSFILAGLALSQKLLEDRKSVV